MTRSNSDFHVLVTEADSLGAVAVIRSLGRAGYKVHAVSRRPRALGFHSRFAASAAVSPSYQDPRFIDWLRERVRDKKIQAIVPSESFLLAIQPCIDEFRHLLPLSEGESENFYRGLSKYDLFSSTHRENCPPLLLIDFDREPDWRDQLSAKLTALGSPLYLKFDAIYSTHSEAGRVVRVENPEQAIASLETWSRRYSRVVVQGHVPGQGVGAFFVVWQGRIVANFMHRRLHEVPHTGGISSYREAFFHDAIYEDAKRRILAFGWQGPVMMEYRWCAASDRFYLMEMNGRFWGSLHLPIYAGVDFPEILLRCFRGETVVSAAKGDYRRDVRCRLTVPGEVQYLLSKWHDPEVSWVEFFRSALEVFGLTFHPRVYSDLFSFKGDRGLFFWELIRYVREVFGSRLCIKK